MSRMKGYIKPFFLVVLNNSFLLLFLYALSDFRYWGIICTLIPGLGWFISFSMLIVCVRYVKLPKHIAQNTEMGRILSSECTTYKKDGDTDA